MKAVVATRYGGPEALSISQWPEPVVGDHDVLIAVKAAGLNPLDFKIRDGKVRLVIRKKPPIALGCDVAGVIEQVGSAVRGLVKGDEVFARLEKNRMGGIAQRVAADYRVVAKKPANASFVEAAAVPLVGLTSLQALREVAGLQAGQRVLIHAGAGGIGTVAIQIAKILGLWVATTTSTKNLELVTRLGADQVIDYTKHEPLPSGLDAVFDTLGGASELASLAAVKPGGIVVGIGGMPDAEFARAHLPLFARPVIWLATAKRRAAAAKAGARFVYWFMRPDAGELAELAGWIDAGKLRPIVHKTFAIDRAREAFAELETGRARGKIVITL
jgi:alcohol dehydrogenase